MSMRWKGPAGASTSLCSRAVWYRRTLLQVIHSRFCASFSLDCATWRGQSSKESLMTVLIWRWSYVLSSATVSGVLHYLRWGQKERWYAGQHDELCSPQQRELVFIGSCVVHM